MEKIHLDNLITAQSKIKNYATHGREKGKVTEWPLRRSDIEKGLNLSEFTPAHIAQNDIHTARNEPPPIIESSQNINGAKTRK